jgi:hypothetical protein
MWRLASREVGSMSFKIGNVVMAIAKNDIIYGTWMSDWLGQKGVIMNIKDKICYIHWFGEDYNPETDYYSTTLYPLKLVYEECPLLYRLIL